MFRLGPRLLQKWLSQQPAVTCAVLFPGQGSQYVGMCRQLLSVGGVEELFEEAESVLQNGLKKLCLEGPQEELDRTINCQPAVMLASLAALKKLEVHDQQAYEGITVAAGFSVGELTALVASGVMTLTDGLRLVQARAKAMQHACEITPSALTSVTGIDDGQLTQMCQELVTSNEVLTVANFLFPQGRVVSGSLPAIERFEEAASKAGLKKKVKRLPVSGAFHSSLMEPAVEEFKEALSQVKLNPTKFPVYSNVTGLPYKSTHEVTELLVRQICQPVLWEQGMRHMLSNFELAAFYEVGPKRQLRAMLQRIDSAAAQTTKNIEA